MQFSGIILTILNLCVLCVHSETSDKNCNNSSENTPPIVEYSLDHEVSSKDAKAAAMEITDDALNSVPKWCLPCSKKSIQYCLGHHLLHDHCCCEHGHTREKLPYIPHSCYIGENHCYPHMGSCNLYTEMWECCCQKILAQKWKATYSSSSRCWNHLMTSYLLLFIPSLIFLFSLPFRL